MLNRRSALFGLFCVVCGGRAIAQQAPKWRIGQRIVCTNNSPTPDEIKCGDSDLYGPWVTLVVGQTYVITSIFSNVFTSDEAGHCADSPDKQSLLAFTLDGHGDQPFWEGRFEAGPDLSA